MESVHGVDISWMSKHSSNGANSRDQASRPPASRSSSSPPSDTKSKLAQNGNGTIENDEKPITPKSTPPRPSYSRSSSTERTATLNLNPPKAGSPSQSPRRNSWLSSISSKFSSSPGAHVAHTAQILPGTPPITTEPLLPESPPVPIGPSAPKNAILQHGVKAGPGDSPYVPAPPKIYTVKFLTKCAKEVIKFGGSTCNACEGSTTWSLRAEGAERGSKS